MIIPYLTFVVFFLVVMQAQREAPPDIQCKDKFLVQSVVLPDDDDHKDISQELVSNNFLFKGVCSFSVGKGT
jgi:hypothetical protein